MQHTFCEKLNLFLLEVQIDIWIQYLDNISSITNVVEFINICGCMSKNSEDAAQFFLEFLS